MLLRNQYLKFSFRTIDRLKCTFQRCFELAVDKYIKLKRSFFFRSNRKDKYERQKTSLNWTDKKAKCIFVLRIFDITQLQNLARFLYKKFELSNHLIRNQEKKARIIHVLHEFGTRFSDHIMAPYKSYKFRYYDFAMIGLESYMVQSMVSLKP